LFEQAYDEIKFIFAKFQDESTATGMEGETLPREFARVWGKDIDENHYIDRGLSDFCLKVIHIVF